MKYSAIVFLAFLLISCYIQPPEYEIDEELNLAGLAEQTESLPDKEELLELPEEQRICYPKEQYSRESQKTLKRWPRIERAARILSMVRGVPHEGESQDYSTAMTRRILNLTDSICPEYSTEVFALGMFESGYLSRFSFGDWRIHREEDDCPSGWYSTSRGCYSRSICDSSEENCRPTSCGYWQVRTIYQGRPTCRQLTREPEYGIEYACEWAADHWPNVAAYNAGHNGARRGLGQSYANRIFIAVALIEGEGNLEKWDFHDRRLVQYEN